MTLKTAAVIKSGVVVNVCVYDEESSGSWLAAVKAENDSVLIVDEAGIGWEEYKKGKVRPQQPSDDCSWDDTNGVWVCPEPDPEPDPELSE